MYFQCGMCDYLLPQTTLSSCTDLEGYGIGGQPNICFKSVEYFSTAYGNSLCIDNGNESIIVDLKWISDPI
jgi:hypothetical protein